VLKEIKKPNREHAQHLFQCLVVAERPLRTQELAEVLAVDFDDVTGIPKLNTDWRWEDQEQALLSSCSSLIAIVNDGASRIVQLSHSSVKEFLTSDRLATSSTDVSCYYLDLKPAHTILAQACLGVLLQLDDHVNKIDQWSSSPLAGYAADYWVHHLRFGNVSTQVQEAMEYLFDPDMPHFEFIIHGADATSMDKDRSTLLHLASRLGRLDLARLLVEHGADAAAQDKNRSTPLHQASRSGSVEVARLLVEHGANVTAQDKDQSTPLHRASQDGHHEISLVLLQCGADANCRDENYMTPLHLASRLGHVEVVEILLTHGAYPNARDESDWTPLSFASPEGHLDVVRLLLNRGEDSGALHIASEHEDHARFPSLVVVPNAENDDNQTPLFLASRNGRLEVAQFLLENGADLQCLDWLKRSPLHGASENGHYDVTRFLLDKGADADARDAHLWTPLHMASKTGQFTVAQLLLDYGAEVDAQDDLRWTPLHMASQEGHQDVVQLLLDCGADVGTLEGDDETALHLAAYYGRLRVTELLLEHHANTYARNKAGKTPFDLASKESHHDVARLLQNDDKDDATA